VQTAPPDEPRTRRVSVRISARGAELIRDRAAGADVTPSHMARRMLDHALRHMPAGYLPPRVKGAAPPAGAKRAKFGFRLPARTWTAVCERATAEDVKPSHLVRRMFDFAVRTMSGRYVPLGGPRA
jgi:hypothetical protein